MQVNQLYNYIHMYGKILESTIVLFLLIEDF